MDKLTEYRRLIRRLITDLAAMIEAQHPASSTGVEALPVIDDERGHYLLVKLGWRGQERVRAITLHVRLREGRIWIEEDMTEPCLTDRLLEEGVTKSDIVLAFQPPGLREFTEFAPA